jgi:hypothetical protein
MAKEHYTEAGKLQPVEMALLVLILLIFLIFPYIMVIEHIQDVKADSYYIPYKIK